MGDPISGVIRVVLADDHPVVRDGLSALLGSVPGIEVVGTASTGREAIRAAVTVRPQVVVLDVQMPELDGAGARGYVLKGASQEEIVRAIRAVAAGEAIFGPGVARRVLGQLSGPAAVAHPFPELTPREREVLELLAAGVPTAVIGARLGLATKAVTNHASTLFAKLQVSGRAEAVQRARRAGFGRAGRPDTWGS